MFLNPPSLTSLTALYQDQNTWEMEVVMITGTTTQQSAAGTSVIAVTKLVRRSILWDTISMSAVPSATTARIQTCLYPLQSQLNVLWTILLFWVMADVIIMAITIQKNAIGTLEIVVIKIVQLPIGIIPMNAAPLHTTARTHGVAPRPASS